MLIIPYLSNSDIHRVAFIWWCLTNLRDQTANNSVCIVLITKSYSCCTFFSRTPHYFQLTNWFTHSISDILRICSKSLFVCLLSVWSHWCLQARLSYSTTLSCGLLDSKETKTSKCSALLLRGWWLGDNWRLQISDLTFILPSPTPHSKEQLSFQWFFKQETLQKKLPRTNRPEWYGHRDAIFWNHFFRFR